VPFDLNPSSNTYSGPEVFRLLDAGTMLHSLRHWSIAQSLAVGRATAQQVGLDSAPATRDQVVDENNHRDHEQDVDEAAERGARHESQQPEHEQYDEDGPQHGFAFPELIDSLSIARDSKIRLGVTLSIPPQYVVPSASPGHSAHPRTGAGLRVP